MSWANVGFIVVLVMLLAAWVACDPQRRRGWARQRAVRRAERVVRAAHRDQQREQRAVSRAREQADLDAIHRNYRTSVRYYQAGGDPGELGPVWLPSKGPHPGTGSRSPESSRR